MDLETYDDSTMDWAQNKWRDIADGWDRNPFLVDWLIDWLIDWLQKEDIRRLEAFEIWIWRRMMKVPWTEHKTNEETLQMVETEREIMDTVRSRHG